MSTSKDVLECPLDGKPCSRSASAFDGDLDCHGHWAFVADDNVVGADSVTFLVDYVEVPIVPVCPRFKRDDGLSPSGEDEILIPHIKEER